MDEELSIDPRTKLLRSLAQELLELDSGRKLIAIDGVDGSGKSTFARDLAAVIHERPVLLIHTDDFLNLRKIRHKRGRDSPEGFWLDTYDYESLHRFVLSPLGKDGSGVYRPAATDHRGDARLEPELRQASENLLVLVEGMFLHRDELAGIWDYSIYLDVPFSETARRMSLRDGSHANPEHPSMLRYVGGQRLYFKSAQPWQRATRVVDNTLPKAPRILSAAEVLRR